MGVRFSRRGEETAVRGRRQGRRKLVVRSTDCGGVSALHDAAFNFLPRGYQQNRARGGAAFILRLSADTV